MRPRGLVGEDALATRLLEGGKLQVGSLVFGRDPRIADFHGPYFVPDFWHSQAVDLSGTGKRVKTLDFWHSKANSASG